MQIDIRDTQVFQHSLKVLHNLQIRIKDKVNFTFDQLQKKQDEVNQELSISNNFLNFAKANEMQKQVILAQKTAELAKALQQEAAAIATGNPVAIAAATAYAAEKAHEEMVAQQEYQEARQNRINMEQRVELTKKAKQQIDVLYEQIKIQLQGAQSKIIMLTQTTIARLTRANTSQLEYISQNNIKNIDESKYKNIPRTGGIWSGEPGNSKWKPDRGLIPKQPFGNKKSWGEILDEYGIDGIEFNEGEVDFIPVIESSVKISDFTERDDNFRQADELQATNWNNEVKDGRNNWSARDVKNYRKEKKLTWHERSDEETLDLVPQEIHSNISHSGGIAKRKKRLKLEEDNG